MTNDKKARYKVYFEVQGEFETIAEALATWERLRNKMGPAIEEWVENYNYDAGGYWVEVKQMGMTVRFRMRDAELTLPRDYEYYAHGNTSEVIREEALDVFFDHIRAAKGLFTIERKVNDEWVEVK